MKKFNKSSVAVVIALVVSFVSGFTGPIAAFAAGPATVNLGTAGNFVILAKTAITTTGVTSIIGDIGVSPAAATTMTGFALVLDGSGTFSTSALVSGKIYASDYAVPTPADMSTAVSNMEAAYTDASTRAPGVGATNLNVGGGTLNGQNFVPGTYTWNVPGSVTITGDITLTGTATDIWILQITGNLSIDAGKKINLAGGALPQNVFWAVAGTTTIKPGATFSGIILGGPGASTIAMQSGAILNGRALGQTDVTLIANTVSVIVPPVPPPTPVVVSGGGGGGGIALLIGLTKVPSPLVLSGSGPVTYDYTAWNVGGQQPLVNVTLTDDKCSPVVFLSGDTNNNGKIDSEEKWKYSCTVTLSKTTTNTAIATGYSDDFYHQATVATAITTVVVNAPLPAPIINITKVPSRLTSFPHGGGNVTYTYTVTNPGVVAMSNVVVTDDKCAPVSGRSGDTNGNNLLDPGEAWVYTCQMNIPVSTSNVAKVQGMGNGFGATGYAYATVLVSEAAGQVLGISTNNVSTPGLPNTGFPPEEKSTPWNAIILAGVLAAISALVVVVLRKRTRINNQ